MRLIVGKRAVKRAICLPLDGNVGGSCVEEYFGMAHQLWRIQYGSEELVVCHEILIITPAATGVLYHQRGWNPTDRLHDVRSQQLDFEMTWPKYTFVILKWARCFRCTLGKMFSNQCLYDAILR